MAVETGTATGYVDLLGKLKTFLTKANSIGSVVPGGGNVGNGTVTGITAVNSAPTETWTLTATTVGPGATFSVSGSVSGAKAAATSGVAYNNGIVAFTITDGGTAYAIGDSFTFTVTMVMGTQLWTVKAHNVNYDSAGNDELYLMAPGSSATDQIYVGIRTYHNATEPYYNWCLAGYTGYSGAATFFTQSGTIGDGIDHLPQVLLNNASMTYWFVANGRRVVGVVKVGTVYECFYLGFLLPYGTPVALPYPLAIGGSAFYNDTASYRKYTTTDYSHRAFPDPAGNGDTPSRASLMFLNGSWNLFANYAGEGQTNVSDWNNIWPYLYANAYSVNVPNALFWSGDPNIDGSFTVLPLMLAARSPSKNIFGELQGCFAVHGIGVVSEDQLTISGKTYKVFQNTFHTQAQNYWALLWE